MIIIGGPHDGQSTSLNDPVIRMAVRPVLDSFSAMPELPGLAEYRLSTLATRLEAFRFYVHSSMSNEDALRALIEGYRRGPVSDKEARLSELLETAEKIINAARFIYPGPGPEWVKLANQWCLAKESL